jgi:hypothetical protein
MKTESSTDKKPEVVLDAVYQLQMPNGEFKKKYVKTVRTYGDEHGEDQVEAEIILDTYLRCITACRARHVSEVHVSAEDMEDQSFTDS